MLLAAIRWSRRTVRLLLGDEVVKSKDFLVMMKLQEMIVKSPRSGNFHR